MPVFSAYTKAVQQALRSMTYVMREDILEFLCIDPSTSIHAYTPLNFFFQDYLCVCVFQVTSSPNKDRRVGVLEMNQSTDDEGNRAGGSGGKGRIHAGVGCIVIVLFQVLHLSLRNESTVDGEAGGKLISRWGAVGEVWGGGEL